MDFKSIAQSVWDQFVTVWSTPVPFIAAGIALWLLMRWFYASQYQTRMANCQSTKELLERQLQEYKDKLSGATPDAAQALIRALEERVDQMGSHVARLSPRVISADQRNTMSRILDSHRGSVVKISSDMALADSVHLQKSLQAASLASSWQTSTSMFMGAGNPPPSGIGINVPDPSSLTGPQEAILRAFKEAGLAFDLRQGVSPPMGDGPTPDAEIMLTAPLRDT